MKTSNMDLYRLQSPILHQEYIQFDIKENISVCI